MSTAIRNTIYRDYVSQQIKALGDNGGGVWSFKDLANVMGLSPTHNLRKQLRHHEKAGNLWIGYGAVGEHGTCYLYHIMENEQPNDGFIQPNF